MQLKKRKYILVQELLYEAVSVFEKDYNFYANMNYISNPKFKSIGIFQFLKIKIDFFKIHDYKLYHFFTFFDLKTFKRIYLKFILTIIFLSMWHDCVNVVNIFF